MQPLTQLELDALLLAATSIADYPDAMDATFDAREKAALRRAIRKLEDARQRIAQRHESLSLS